MAQRSKFSRGSLWLWLYKYSIGTLGKYVRSHNWAAEGLRLVSRKNSILFLPEREVTPESRVLAEVTPDIIFGHNYHHVHHSLIFVSGVDTA